MKQIFQDLKTKKIRIEDIPDSVVRDEHVLVRTHYSVISSGTEKTIIDTASKNLLQKAQARPDLVKQVFSKMQKDGLLSTYNSVLDRLDKPIALGYSASGEVIKVGNGISEYNIGDKVAIAGAGYANHSTINCVPKNLVAKIPNNVSMENAAYTTIASIAMQGIRVAKPQIGEFVAVSGLGLVGLTTVMLLKSNGCIVCGIDLDENKILLAKKMGIDFTINLKKDNAEESIKKFSGGMGVDHTLICASTDNNEPIKLAGNITRSKGVVTVVGTVGMDIPRQPYYLKELEIRLSMSYGPGRYDLSYEEMGIDYPYGYVRWTEKRNMSSVLNLMSQNKLDFSNITTHKFLFEDAKRAYDIVKNNDLFVGIMLDYNIDLINQKKQNILFNPAKKKNIGDIKIGFIGLGNYAEAQLIPNMRVNRDIELIGLCNSTGISSKKKAEKHGFAYSTADFQEIVDNEKINTVFISTLHSTHFEYSMLALKKSKNLFVEKPPCINIDQLNKLSKLYEKINKRDSLNYMVGFNRRFSSHILKIKKYFGNKNSISQILYRINGGPISLNSWVYEDSHGGGMLIGEMCHFINVMIFITQSEPNEVFAYQLDFNNENSYKKSDNICVIIKFSNGSIANMVYNTIGNKNLKKEYMEIYSDGIIGIVDDFKSSEIISNKKNIKHKTRNQDKGQKNMLDSFFESILEGKENPIPFNEIATTMNVVFAIKKSLRNNTPQKIN